MIYKNKKYILLDGAHRIVASYIEGKKYINVYIIKN
jgi:ParB-like chromosome segregation protein Spo0J